MRLKSGQRTGTTAVECAVVYPSVFLFTLGLIIGAAGIFRYQELSSLARRAARYAVVHGTDYAKVTGNPAPTPADIYNSQVVPNTVGLDTSKLSYSITYNTSNSPIRITTVNGAPVAVTNTVTVTLTYQWVPEGFLGGITLSSTSVMPMSY
jgi:Flp pilus assembly protein TadG